MRTAESVVFTDWPPGPDERKTSILRSFWLIAISSGSSTSGNTSTPGRRGVDAPLRLGGGNPLHAVHTALVLEVRPDAWDGSVELPLIATCTSL